MGGGEKMRGERKWLDERDITSIRRDIEKIEETCKKK